MNKRKRLRHGARVILSDPLFWPTEGTVVRLTRRTVAVLLDGGVTVITDRWNVRPA